MNGYIEVTKDKLTTILNKLPKDQNDLIVTTEKYLQSISIVNSANDPSSGSVSYIHSISVPTEYILALNELNIFE